jgi:hypothetical protein
MDEQPTDPRPVVQHYRAAMTLLATPASSDQATMLNTAAAAYAALAGAGLTALRWRADQNDRVAIAALRDIAAIALGQKP